MDIEKEDQVRVTLTVGKNLLRKPSLHACLRGILVNGYVRALGHPSHTCVITEDVLENGDILLTARKMG